MDQSKEPEKEKEESADIYGFKKRPDEKDETKSKDRLKQNNARIEKWRKMMPNIEKMMSSNDDKLKTRLRKGIPDGVRMLVWPLLAEVDSMQKAAQVRWNMEKQVTYKELVDSPTVSPYENQIQLDIVRTFQNNHLFTQNSITSQSLYKVLRAISLQFEKMGYCQGLNFLAGSFLLVMNDDMAFWHVFSILVPKSSTSTLTSTQTPKTLLSLMKQFIPDVNKKLEKLDIQPFYYAAEWFITLFSSILPIKLFLRVMDVFWNEKIKAIFRTALAIIKIRKEEILNAKTFDVAITILKDHDFFYKYDPDKFMKIASLDFIFSTAQMNKLFDDYKQEKKLAEQKKAAQTPPK